jgi:peroxiredoxin
MRRFVAGVLLALAVAAGPAMAAQPDYAGMQLEPLEGKPAAPFALPDLDGKTVRLEDFRGKVVMLFFWATWCPFCKEELPSVNKLAAELKGQGLELLMVDIREPADLVRKVVRERGYTARVVLDESGDVAGKQYGVYGTPTVVLINPQGGMLAWAIGPRKWDSPQGRAFLQSLLASTQAAPVAQAGKT